MLALAALITGALFGLFPVATQAQKTEWNDARTLVLVQRAVDRRSRQFASGLTDYTAAARGYLTFLGQFGEGFPEPPRVVKVDQLAVQLLWKAR